jgi:hypothetical protein
MASAFYQVLVSIEEILSREATHVVIQSGHAQILLQIGQTRISNIRAVEETQSAMVSDSHIPHIA